MNGYDIYKLLNKHNLFHGKLIVDSLPGETRLTGLTRIALKNELVVYMNENSIFNQARQQIKRRRRVNIIPVRGLGRGLGYEMVWVDEEIK